jgi:hypothetical protein
MTHKRIAPMMTHAAARSAIVLMLTQLQTFLTSNIHGVTDICD